MTADGREAQLDVERRALERIWSAHVAYLDKNRQMAEGLAAEAAEAIEDGIRDIIDEDAEADTAIRAVLVRQSAQRAMAAARRVADLEAQGDALAFGHFTSEDGQRLAVGRRTVLDGDEPLLVDWRARASIPFYRATPIEPLGVVHRRHLIYDDPKPGSESHLIDYTDEVFNLEAAERANVDRSSLRGEAALLNALRMPTAEQMRSAVATIQAEQDAVVRAPIDRTLVVQGAPGTGKTVVALHRAAYLLYDQREELAETGVLLVGPTKRFLHYIAGVLPALGESGVVSVTVPSLYRGASVSGTEAEAVAELKGRLEMAAVLKAGVALRQRLPSEPLRLWYGSRSVRLDTATLVALFRKAQRHREHNGGAIALRSLLVERLAAEVYDPAFGNMDDARDTFAASPEVKRFLLAHYPLLRPEQALNDLLGSPALLKAACGRGGLAASDAALLGRPRTPERNLRTVGWTEADMALLDELYSLLGPVWAEPDEDAAEVRDELDPATDDGQAGEDEVFERLDDETDIEFAADPDVTLALPFDAYYADDLDEDAFDEAEAEWTPAAGEEDEPEGDEPFRGVVESDGTPITELELEGVDAETEEGASVLELALAEEAWQFGHVIVDEAQELSAMAWRMVLRRSATGALTIVGDLAQRTTGQPASSWAEVLPEALSEVAYRELTINYRSPTELEPLVHRLGAVIAPALTQAKALRSSGEPVRLVPVEAHAGLANAVLEACRWPEPGRLAVITVDPETMEVALQSAGWAGNGSILTPSEAKGLEFDSVVVVEPADVLEGSHGLSHLYVALTRATTRLAIVHQRPLPEVLGEY